MQYKTLLSIISNNPYLDLNALKILLKIALHFVNVMT